jgi:sugar/nucleoside kinase (ribokinase family)
MKLPWVPPGGKEFDVVGMGCAAMDVLAIVERMPALDEKMHALEMDRQGGGPVATALVVAARMGFKTAFAGQVGDDFAGQFIIDEFKREGVDLRGEVVHPRTESQISLILVDRSTGKRTVVSGRGTIADAVCDRLRHEMSRRGKIVHLDGYDMDAAICFADECKAAGGIVVYDAGSVYDGSVELLARTDVAVTSRTFAEKMFGHRDWEAACRALTEMGPSYAGVTLGEQGAVGLDGEDFFEVAPFKIEPVVDTTGAGDVFHGALDVGILKGWGFKTCMIFASAAAAMKCRRLGGRAGIPTFAEATAFLKERGYDFK